MGSDEKSGPSPNHVKWQNRSLDDTSQSRSQYTDEVDAQPNQQMDQDELPKPENDAIMAKDEKMRQKHMKREERFLAALANYEVQESS